MLTPDQHTRLHQLITGNEGGLDTPADPLTGATLTVTNADHQVVFRAPLARMWRHEPAEATIWLRPIVTTPDLDRPISASNGFPLATNRRRSISYTAVATTPSGGLHFTTTEGQTALIDPIDIAVDRGDAQRLEAWDTFTLAILPDATVVALEALNEDSWNDQWA